MELAAIIATVIPAFFPVVIDGVKMGLSRLFGYSVSEPKSFADSLEMEKLSIEKIKALAILDRPAGEVSRWVADLRGSMRYLATAAIILATLIYNFLDIHFSNPDGMVYMNQLCGSALFFLFGDRLYTGLKNKK